jgi:peptide/nickel transport system permease protein
MARYLGKRLIQMFFVFIVFLTILFFLINAQPGDISQQFTANPLIPPEAKQILRERLGLDQPLYLQYLHYIKNVFVLDFGDSFDQYPRPVSELLLAALPRTLYLFLTATILAYLIGFQTGKMTAWSRGSFKEKGTMVTSIILYTVFYPWFALLMLWFFGSVLGWFPIGKFLDPQKWFDAPYTANQVFNTMLLTMFLSALAVGLILWGTRKWIIEPAPRTRVRRILLLLTAIAGIVFWLTSPMQVYAADIAYHTVLPVTTLTLVFYAGITLLTRSSMLETLREDYIFTARAKGVPEKAIRDRHAARNAMLPVTTSFVLAIAFVIGGGIVTESIFSWPGLGLALLSAVQTEDVPVAMGALAFIGILALFAHLVADILYVVLDPRIRIKA